MITVDLNQTTEQQLRMDAQAKGITTEDYAREILEEALTGAKTVGQQLLDELEQEGVLGAWQERPESQDAQVYARQTRDQAWQRNQEG